MSSIWKSNIFSSKVKRDDSEVPKTQVLSAGKRIGIHGIQWNKMKFTVDRPANGGGMSRNILQKVVHSPEAKKEPEYKGKVGKKKVELESLENELNVRVYQAER